MEKTSGYHHGNLRAALIEQAIKKIAEETSNQ